MSEPFINLTSLVGDKPLYKSMTVWGLALWQMGQPVLDSLCSAGILDVDTCGTAGEWLVKIGVILTGLGIRRAATSPNTG